MIPVERVPQGRDRRVPLLAKRGDLGIRLLHVFICLIGVTVTRGHRLVNLLIGPSPFDPRLFPFGDDRGETGGDHRAGTPFVVANYVLNSFDLHMELNGLANLPRHLQRLRGRGGGHFSPPSFSGRL